ncbi:MAG TPA: MarR family winged helix-turn-helix transcriptional regulator [Gaiellales bacterium]|jgi:DNA-binding MarR family transcriptional regulator|nr:MarR family winged helix-turn-helix transcriptional regulator [Gaiellales bacterium]
MPPHPRPRNTAETLAAVAPLVTRWMERVLAAAEPPLSLGQYLGLRAIAAGVDSAADLARATGVSESAVSQLVAAFERAGTVERTPTGDDRRRRRLALTPDGERLLGTAQELVGARLEPLVTSLAPDDADALAALLRRIEPALTATAPPRRPPPQPPKHHHAPRPPRPPRP